MSVYVCRTSQARVLREFVVKQVGPERACIMTDNAVEEWLDENGYTSYICYTGEYDDSDDVLIAKSADIANLISSGKAFWATRNGKLEQP